MADNIVLPANGIPTATDEIGGVHHQRIKTGYGPDGSYTDVDAATGLPVAAGYVEHTGSIAANGAVAFTALDVSAYRWAQIQITGTWSGTLRFSVSMDGTNWVNVHGGQVDLPSNIPTTAPTNGLWGVPLNARYFRVIASAWTSGTATVVAGFSAAPSYATWSQLISGATSNTVTDDVSGFMEFKVGALSMVFDGTNWDRARNVAAVDGSGSTGLLAAGAIAYDAGAAVNRRVRCDAAGTLHTRAPGTGTSATTSVSAATTSTTLLAAKTSRVQATFFNDSTNYLYLKVGATASTTSFTIKMAPGGYYELPVTAAGVYTGVVDGIWDGTNGAARVTEVG